jgi:lysyl-tRNA synthetase class 2
MSRPPLNFLRPYLYQGARSLKPEHARAYLSVQRRFAQTVAADAYTGPHDVEKQKRLDQLKKVKPLGDYHPQMVYPAGVESLSLREFNAKYHGIQETNAGAVSVFGMYAQSVSWI